MDPTTNTHGNSRLEQAIRRLPRPAPPPELAQRIMTALPPRPGWAGSLQYALFRPRRLAPERLALPFLLIALLHLALAAALFSCLPRLGVMALAPPWLLLQPPLLAALAAPPLLVAVLLQRGWPVVAWKSLLLLYVVAMVGNACYPLLINQNLFLGLAGLWLLLPAASAVALLSVVRADYDLWRSAHACNFVILCRP